MKKIISLALFTLVLTFSFDSLAKSQKEVTLTFENEQTESSKIVFEGFNVPKNASYEEMAEALTEDENTNVTVQIQFDYEYLNDPRYRIRRNTDIDAFLSAYRAEAALYHLEMNKSLVESMKLEGYEDSYLSDYSPFIDLYYDETTFLENSASIIGELVESDIVETAYIQNVEKPVDNNFVTAQYASDLYSTMSNDTLTGTGVTVGILEVGVVDKNHPNFVGTDLTVRDEWYFFEKVTEHATQVASIIGGKNGIAPNAKLLSVQADGTLNSEVDWLISQGVNVINMSFGDEVGNGLYSSRAAYVDYVVRTYFISVVAAAGNDGHTTAYVNDPAIGYNVITVGATSASGYELEEYSSYVERTGSHKPTLVAPSSFIVPGYDKVSSGTSFSAPMVTGAVALFMEKYPDLKSYPEKVISMLTATAKAVNGNASKLSSGLNDKVGAGRLDFIDAINSYTSTETYFNTTGTSGTYKTIELYMRFNTKLKASLAWIIYSTGSTTAQFTDYDIRLFDPMGRPVASATSQSNNIELIEYTTSVTGRYKLVIYQNGAIVGGKDWLSLTYTFGF